MPKDEEKEGQQEGKSVNNNNYNSSFWHNFITAGISASIAVTTMAPVERVKLILQIQNCMDQKLEKPYKNARDVFRRLVTEQGFYSLWRGNLASVIRCFPYQALNFAFKDKYNVLLMDKMSESTITRQVFASIIAGGVGGCTATTIVYPLDFARTRMALNNATNGPDVGNLRRTLLNTYKRDGIRGIYRGYPFSLIGVFIYRSTYFGLYDTAKLLTPVNQRNIYTTFLQAEAAATISGLASYGFDTVRRAMMMQNEDFRKAKKTRDCIRNIYEKKGFLGFYQGAGINILRGSGGAIMLVLYDKIQEFVEGTPPPYRHVTKSLTIDTNPAHPTGSRHRRPNHGHGPAVADHHQIDVKNDQIVPNNSQTVSTNNNNNNKNNSNNNGGTLGQNDEKNVKKLHTKIHSHHCTPDRYSRGLCDF